MKVIAKNKLAQAREMYPDADKNLLGWYQVLSQGDFKTESSLKLTFGDIQEVDQKFMFPIPQSKLFVHAMINFDAQVVLIDSITPANH